MSEYQNREAAGAQGRRETGRRPTRGFTDNLWVGVLILMAWALMMASAFGQVYQIRVDKVACVNLGCRRYSEMASAVCIGRFNKNKELLLTTREAVTGGQIQGLWLRNGLKWLPAKLVKISGNRDLAVIGVDTEALHSVQVSKQIPSPGGYVAVGGYPANGASLIRIQQARILHMFRGDLFVNRSTDVGERGGGVFDTDGRLIGLVSMSGVGRSACEPAKAIREFLMRSFQQMPTADPPPPKDSTPPKKARPYEAGEIDLLKKEMEKVAKENEKLRERVFALELGRGKNQSPSEGDALAKALADLTARIERFEGNDWKNRELISQAINAANERIDHLVEGVAKSNYQPNSNQQRKCSSHQNRCKPPRHPSR